jgi:hypothetical protein
MDTNFHLFVKHLDRLGLYFNHLIYEHTQDWYAFNSHYTFVLHKDCTVSFGSGRNKDTLTHYENIDELCIAWGF